MAVKTYAQEAKTIMNRYKLRLGENFDKGDPLALEAMNKELAKLQEHQEQARAALFPEMEKRFAKGGRLPKLQGKKYSFIPQDSTTLSDPLGTTSIGGYQDQNSFGAYDNPSEFGTFGENVKDVSGFLNTNVGNFLGDNDYKSRVPWFGALSQGLTSILGNKQIDFAGLPEYQYDEYKPKKTAANLVSYAKGRQGIANERDIASQIIKRNARGMGSRSGLMENIQAGVTGTQRIAGQGIEESYEKEANLNAQIRNQIDQANAAREAQAMQMNQRNKMFASQIDYQNAMAERENQMINQGRKDAQIGGVGEAITGYGKDILAAGQYDQMPNMLAPDNYSIGSGKDSLFRRLFQISPDMKIRFRNTNDKVI